MIEIFTSQTKFGLKPLDFVNMLYFLRKKGNKFMILEGKIGMLTAAGIDIQNKDIFNWMSRNIIEYDNKRVHDADIFIDDGDFMYIINHESTWKGGERLELGMITRNPKNVNNKFSKFTKAIINAIESTIDKRRIRYFDLKWYVNGTSWEITSRRFPAGKFSESYLLDEEIKAAKLLENNSIKERPRFWHRQPIKLDPSVYQNGFPYRPFGHYDCCSAISQAGVLLAPENLL